LGRHAWKWEEDNVRNAFEDVGGVMLAGLSWLKKGFVGEYVVIAVKVGCLTGV
jgi:hypothetical protein